MNKKIIRFALGSKCGCLGSNGSTGAERDSPASIADNAMDPKPTAECFRDSLLEGYLMINS
jgi:hypothetical protein